MEDSSNFLQGVNVNLVQAMNEDGYNIQEIREKSELFRRSSDVCDRKEIIHYLEETCEHQGSFVCLLGGKSFGKSKCLSFLAKEANKGITHFYKHNKITNAETDKKLLVLLVDMRSEGNKSIIDGLVKSLNEINDSDVKKITLKVEKRLFNVAASLGFLGFFRRIVGGTLSEVYDSVCGQLSQKGRIDLRESLINELSQTKKVTVIIDEANLAFERSSLNEQQLPQSQADLALLTRLTKQENKVRQLIHLSFSTRFLLDKCNLVIE
jgi:hypothetical protein